MTTGRIQNDHRQFDYTTEEFERQPMIEVDAYRRKFYPQGQPV